MSVEVKAAKAKKLLATKLKPAIEAGAMGIAAAIQNVVAPYPKAAPRQAGKSYYVRGKGLFSSGGKLQRSSETLNRRWKIKKISFGARLNNNASYAQYVHGRKKQNRYHGKRGWIREDQAIQQVKASGEMAEIMHAAINATFKENAK